MSSNPGTMELCGTPNLASCNLGALLPFLESESRKTLNLAPCETVELTLYSDHTLFSTNWNSSIVFCLCFVLLLTNQDKTLTSLEPSLMLGTLNSGNLEPQNPGNLELWNLGELCNLAILETCNCGILEPCKALEPSPITVQPWNTGARCWVAKLG